MRWSTAAVAAAAVGAGAVLLGLAGFGLHGVGLVGAVVAGSGLACAAPLRWERFGGRDPQRWERGAEGERATARYLDGLASRRWRVWHDLAVPGSRANVDHLVVGRSGVWLIDTKTTRSAVDCRWRRVYFGDRRLDTSTTRWEADVVADRIATLAGPGAGRGERDRSLAVRPLVAVHSPGMRRRGGRAGGVPVVPASEVVRRLRRGRRRLRRDQVDDVVDAVVRAFGRPPASPPGRWARVR